MSSSPAPGKSAPFPQPPPLRRPPLGDPGCPPPSHLHCLAQSVTHPRLAWGLMVSRGPRTAMHTIRKPQSSLGQMFIITCVIPRSAATAAGRGRGGGKRVQTGQGSCLRTWTKLAGLPC